VAALPHSPGAALHEGRIGPNAITRVAEELMHRLGLEASQAIFGQAGLLHHLERPPEAPVDEAEVQGLHIALRRCLGAAAAREVARAAGRRTADYLMARRIPRPVRWLLQALPAPLAARLLLAAITRNAWTFVGSGHFEGRPGRKGQAVQLIIRGNPLCRGLVSVAPSCDFYAATFEHLFASMVHYRARVRELACEACGDAECRFEVVWTALPPVAAAVAGRAPRIGG
jgi:divinyl protochlorophyllide a 8-vinyl-reductase